MWEMNDLTFVNDETRNKIRTAYLQGKEIKQILAEMGLNENSYYWHFWSNYKGFRDFINACELEYLKLQARKNLKEVATMPLPDTEDPRWLKIKTDTSQFIAETLDKENFSKKSEDNKDERTPINIQVNTYKRIQNLKKTLPSPKKAL